LFSPSVGATVGPQSTSCAMLVIWALLSALVGLSHAREYTALWSQQLLTLTRVRRGRYVLQHPQRSARPLRQHLQLHLGGSGPEGATSPHPGRHQAAAGGAMWLRGHHPKGHLCPFFPSFSPPFEFYLHVDIDTQRHASFACIERRKFLLRFPLKFKFIIMALSLVTGILITLQVI